MSPDSNTPSRSEDPRAALTCKQDEFSIEPGVHYLNCAYMGPLPKRSADAGEAGLRSKERPWEIFPSDFFERSDRLRSQFGRLVGGRPDQVAIFPSVSYGIATAARNIRPGPGEEILLVGEQFPGNVYAWRRLAAECGCQIVTIDRPEADPQNPSAVGARWNERVLDAIGPRTRVVSMAPLHWTDGTRFDLEAIGRRAREAGAALIVDATQGVGGTPFDVQAIQPDMLVTGCYKWLLGPYSVAVAWMGPRFEGGVPLEEGWIARRGSDDFKGLVDYTDDYAPGAIRYDMGERSNFALMPVVNSSMDYLLEWGVDRIEDYIATISAQLISTARSLGFHLEEDRWRSRHLFGLGMPAGIDLVDLKDRLEAARIYISLRGNSLRISPNVYNTEADIAALCEVLREVSG